MKAYSFAKLVVRGYPTMNDLRNPYIYTKDIKTIINVSEQAYPKDIAEEFARRGIKSYHFPLVEEGSDMGVDNIMAALRILAGADKAGEKVILHCDCGNNRSRTVAEAFHFLKTGEQLEDQYKSYRNHLLYNMATGHLPNISILENLLADMRKELSISLL